VLPVDETMKIDGGNWSRVRHVPKGPKWYKAKDGLTGTEEYGNPNTMDEEWSVKFDDVFFNQFLFVTGDKKKWLIISRKTLLGENNELNYSNQKRWVLKSSEKDEGHNVTLHRRDPNSYKNDPWVTLTDHNEAI